MVVAYGLRGEGLVCLIGAVVCLLAANCGSNCSLTRAMDGRFTFSVLLLQYLRVSCDCGN